MQKEILERYSFSETIESRFWPKVSIGTMEQCWMWTGSKLPTGYGRIGRGQDGLVPIGAHVLSWIIHNGAFDSNLCVCHKCDNPSCVNPNHLFLGTQQRNLEDMRSKGRQTFGESHGTSKLTQANVDFIRSSDWTQERLATRFGVSQTCISKIKLRQRWKR